MDHSYQKRGEFFEELKLYPGDRMQIEIPSPQHDLRYFTSLVGYVKGLSVLLRTPMVNGLTLPMRDDENVIVRGFSGTDTFSFESSVARVCLAPFAYLHLSYPHAIRITPVRHEVRVKVSLPVAIAHRGSEAASHGTVTNLSLTGIQIDSEEEFGAKNDEVTVTFRFTIHPHGYDARIESKGIIQSVALQPAPSGAIGFQYGVKLTGLHSSQDILLQNLIYQQLLETHRNVA